MIIFGQPINKNSIKQFISDHKKEIVALSVAFILGAIIF